MLSILLPTFNGEKFLPQILKCIIDQTYKDFEVIIVDDNSTDMTSKVIKKFKKKNFHYLIRKDKRDLSKSCILGFEKSRYNDIIVMDGDLQHKPSDIKKILSIFYKTNSDIVVGTRDLFKSKKHNLNFFRLFASRILILIVNLLFVIVFVEVMTKFLPLTLAETPGISKSFISLANPLGSVPFSLIVTNLSST